MVTDISCPQDEHQLGAVHAGTHPPLQLECISSMSRAHGSAPVTSVYFSSDGAPRSAGRDGTLRSYTVSSATNSAAPLVLPSPAQFERSQDHASGESTDGHPSAIMESVKSACSAPQQQIQQHGLAPSPCADHTLQPAAHAGPVQHEGDIVENGTKGRLPAATKVRRAQFLTCVGVEGVPGITAPISEMTATAADGREERLVCGFQARIIWASSGAHAYAPRMPMTSCFSVRQYAELSVHTHVCH